MGTDGGEAGCLYMPGIAGLLGYRGGIQSEVARLFSFPLELFYSFILAND